MNSTLSAIHLQDILSDPLYNSVLSSGQFSVNSTRPAYNWVSYNNEPSGVLTSVMYLCIVSLYLESELQFQQLIKTVVNLGNDNIENEIQ